MGKLFSLDFEIVPPEKAVVSVMDRSFLYGDSVYEVVRTYRGSVPFLLDRHFQRLCRSAERIRLKVPFTLEKLRDHINQCISKASNSETYIRIVVSRGEDIRFDLAPGNHLRPQLVLLVDQIKTFPKSFYDPGIHVALVSVRRNLREALDPNIKSGNYMNNVLALMEARDRGADDAVMLNADGFVTEGTTSNVFIVQGGVVKTPKAEAGILEGISRGLLKEIMTQGGIRFEEADFNEKEFLAADEIFLTGTVKELMPVARVNGQEVGKGSPGPMTHRLMEVWREEVERRTR
ncbi:MAG TPA: aminotransferase class IV [Bdellovibrionota bacterium]|nr:aminotransferase class IV [Bdellovibrionota bacterium]